MLDYNIRHARTEDLPALITIYNQAVLAHQTADSLPLSVEDRHTWFEAHQHPKYPLFVAINKQGILGYGTLSQYRGGRPALRYVVEVSYYLDQAYQGKGVGTSMLQYLLDAAKVLGFKHAYALLLDTNQSSIRLLEKFDFAKWGHLPNIADIDGEPCGQYIYGKHL